MWFKCGVILFLQLLGNLLAQATSETPPRITLQPTDILVKTGSPAAFVCEAEGNPLPVITWYKDGGQVETILDNAFSHRVLIPESPSRLKLLFHSIIHNTKVQPDEGAYYCNATNRLGSAISRAARLRVRVKSGITLEPGTVAWDDAKAACATDQYTLVPGRRYKAKFLKKILTEGQTVWLNGWRAVTDFNKDAKGKVKSLKIDVARKVNSGIALLCETGPDAYSIAAETAKTNNAASKVCASQGKTLANLVKEDYITSAFDVMKLDTPYWIGDVISKKTVAKLCLAAQIKKGKLIYIYDTCSNEHNYACLKSQNEIASFRYLVSFKMSVYKDFQNEIEVKKSLTTSSTMPTTSSTTSTTPATTSTTVTTTTKPPTTSTTASTTSSTAAVITTMPTTTSTAAATTSTTASTTSTTAAVIPITHDMSSTEEATTTTVATSSTMQSTTSEAAVINLTNVGTQSTMMSSTSTMAATTSTMTNTTLAAKSELVPMASNTSTIAATLTPKSNGTTEMTSVMNSQTTVTIANTTTNSTAVVVDLGPSDGPTTTTDEQVTVVSTADNLVDQTSQTSTLGAGNNTITNDPMVTEGYTSSVAPTSDLPKHNATVQDTTMEPDSDKSTQEALVTQDGVTPVDITSTSSQVTDKNMTTVNMGSKDISDVSTAGSSISITTSEISVSSDTFDTRTTTTNIPKTSSDQGNTDMYLTTTDSLITIHIDESEIPVVKEVEDESDEDDSIAGGEDIPTDQEQGNAAESTKTENSDVSNDDWELPLIIAFIVMAVAVVLALLLAVYLHRRRRIQKQKAAGADGNVELRAKTSVNGDHKERETATFNDGAYDI